MSHRRGEGADTVGVGLKGADDGGLLVTGVDKSGGIALGIRGESGVNVSFGGDEESSSGIEDFNDGFREDGSAVVKSGLSCDDIPDFSVDVSSGGVSGGSEGLGDFSETAETASGGLGVVCEFTANSLSALGFDIGEVGFVTVRGNDSSSVSILGET